MPYHHHQSGNGTEGIEVFDALVLKF